MVRLLSGHLRSRSRHISSEQREHFSADIARIAGRGEMEPVLMMDPPRGMYGRAARVR